VLNDPSRRASRETHIAHKAIAIHRVLCAHHLNIDEPLQNRAWRPRLLLTFFHVFGEFANQKDRFLGFRFIINGENHRGRTALSVAKAGFSGSKPVVSASLFGNAYETARDRLWPASPKTYRSLQDRSV